MVFLCIMVVLVWACSWGLVTQKVIYHKGYDINWFLWGFLFGVFALIVACAKPPYKEEMVNLKKLLDMNCITQTEYEEQKNKLLGASSQPISTNQTVQTNTQQYVCPNCGAPVALGEPLCKACGQSFSW